MALSRHADKESRGLTRADFLDAATLEHGTEGPLIGTSAFDAPQLGEDSRIRIQNFNAVGNAVGGLLQNKAQNVSAT